MSAPMIALVAAGGIPQPNDPLYRYSQGGPKGLIDIGGRPMLGRVLDALQASHFIEEIVVIGIDQKIHHPKITTAPNVTFLAGQGSLLANGIAGLEWVARHRPSATSVVACAGDLPLITGEMIDRFIERCSPWSHTLYYPYATGVQFRQRFPNAERTFIPIQDRVICGGDLFVTRVDLLQTDFQLWSKLTNARKSPFDIARMVGWGTLWRLFRRKLTIAEIEAKAGALLKRPHGVKLVQVPAAELAMDGDRPEHIDLLRAEWG